MTQGAAGHTGAQGRAIGFQSVVDRFPNVQVLATDSADWDVAKTARLWEGYLDMYPKIDAAFFHNDDMAPIRTGVPALWPFVTQVIEEATAAGFITAT